MVSIGICGAWAFCASPWASLLRWSSVQWPGSALIVIIITPPCIAPYEVDMIWIIMCFFLLSILLLLLLLLLHIYIYIHTVYCYIVMYSMHMNARISYLYLNIYYPDIIYIYIYVICIYYMCACVYSPKTGIQRVAETSKKGGVTRRRLIFHYPATKWDISCLIPS